MDTTNETALTIIEVTQVLPAGYDDLAHMGAIADEVVSRGVIAEYQATMTANTLRRQKSDLAVFARYLQEAGAARTMDALFSDPEAWRGMTHGIVKGFVKWQGNQGYSIGSINVRLATIKTYCGLAVRSHMLTASKLDLIKTVKGYSHKAGRNLDKGRDVTRLGDKKATATSLNAGHAAQLKRAADTTLHAKRDVLLMCLLLDHGLRCSEIASLLIADIDMTAGLITFYREKVDMEQTHRLSTDTLIAAMAYLALPGVKDGPYLFMGYKGRAISTKGINERVRLLGERIGIKTLSPHDCRHYWATVAMRNKTDIKALQTAGGWKSPAMPLRYAEAAIIANEGVKLV